MKNEFVKKIEDFKNLKRVEFPESGELIVETSSGDYTIRFADVNDAEVLSHIKRQAWDETYRGIYPDEKIDNFDYDKNRETFIKMINNPDISFFVLMCTDKIVGYMSTGKPKNPYKNYEQEISVLYILKEHQGKGLGGLLFKIGKGEIFKRGFDRFFISCNRLNYKAQEFYKKLGGIILSDEDLTENGDSQIHFHYDA